MTNHSPKPVFEPARGQFFRIEKYAVQAPRSKIGGNNLIKVAREAARIEGFCPHIEHPLEPKIVWGAGPLEAAAMAQEWSRKKTGSVFHKPSQTTRIRKYRNDKPSALVGIISVPPEWGPDERWVLFVKKSLEWLVKNYSADRLKSVIEHRDEPCLHLHFWVVPLDGENFNAVHPGEKAIDGVGRKSVRVLRDVAYKQAMAHFLDEFHSAVTSIFGLDRETVGGKRLSRDQWLRQKFLNHQRELEIQKRIADAVAAALLNHKLEQSALVDSSATSDSSLPFSQVTQPVALLQDVASTPAEWVRHREN